MKRNRGHVAINLFFISQMWASSIRGYSDAQAGPGPRKALPGPAELFGAACARPRPSVRIAEGHASIPANAGRRTSHAGGLLWSSKDGVEAEHPEQEHAYKRNCKQECVPTGLNNAVVHRRLIFP